MRTTVTLDPDVEAIVRRAMRERGVSFKQALNDAVRSGTRETAVTVDFPTFRMGEPLVDLTKAVRLAGAFEDVELAARLARGA